jgi:transposase
VAHQPRSPVQAKKGARNRLIRLAQSHRRWAIGFQDETWWSRVAIPGMHAWTEKGKPLHLVEQSVPRDDPDGKALACYGMLVRWLGSDGLQHEQPWLRFVDGRPVSALTTAFLEWSCAKLEAMGQEALLLVWDNASWHVSRQVRGWIHDHNCRVKRQGGGVRLLCCYLPIKSPWLNPIEPHWVHAKRKVAEPARLLTAQQLRQRVCAYFRCEHEDRLAIPEKLA